MVIIPFQRSPPIFEKRATIPIITRNNPAIYIINPATKLNRPGFNIKPRPRIKAIIPTAISRSPKPVLVLLSTIPAIRSPIPKNNTPIPVKTLTETKPNIGKAKTIIPNITSIKPIILFCKVSPLIHLIILLSFLL